MTRNEFLEKWQSLPRYDAIRSIGEFVADIDDLLATTDDARVAAANDRRRTAELHAEQMQSEIKALRTANEVLHRDRNAYREAVFDTITRFRDLERQ